MRARVRECDYDVCSLQVRVVIHDNGFRSHEDAISGT